MSLQCHRCSTKLKTSAAPPGTKAKCPKCGQILVVPAQQVTASSVPLVYPANTGITVSRIPQASTLATAPDFMDPSRPQRSGPPLALLVGIGGVLLVLVVAVCVVVFTRTGHSPSDNSVVQNNNVENPPIDVVPVDGGQTRNNTQPSQSGNNSNPGNNNTQQNPVEPKKPLVVPNDPGNKGGPVDDDKGGRLFTVSDIEFMGSKAKGKRICIIADVSGSMSAQFRKIDPQTNKQILGRKAIDYLKTELLKTLQNLKPEMEFFIILFDSKIEPMPGGKWLTGKDIAQVEPWVNKIYPRGGTKPLPAFQHAFRNLTPRPDVIFFMTDGQFSNNTAPEVAKLNSREPKVIINTIQLNQNQIVPPGGKLSIFQKNSFKQMEDIAAQSGGTFSQLDPTNIDR